MSTATDTRTEREQFLDDVLITGIEGGINYWAALDDYEWQKDDVPVAVWAEIVDHEQDEIKCRQCGETLHDGRGIQEVMFYADIYYMTDTEIEFADRVINGLDDTYQGPERGHEHEPVTVRVDRDTIETAFTRMAAGPIEYMSDEWRAQLLACSIINDCDMDAGDADAIIQVGLFGHVVYG